MRLRTWRPEITFFPASFQLFLRQRMPISIIWTAKNRPSPLPSRAFATGLSGKLESGDIVTVIVADYQGKGETAIPPELQYVEVISVTASSGYDANTGEVVDEKELPSTVTLLVTTEQAKVLAELEQDSELHLALVYRGTPENAAKFIAAQDALIEELYAEPEPENSGETAEGTESKESEGAEPSAESEATE